MKTRLAVKAWLLALLLLAASCGQTGNGDFATSIPDASIPATPGPDVTLPPGLAGLPAPSSLLRNASEISDSQRFKDGYGSDPLLPGRNFSTNSGTYSPAYAGPGSPLADAAYATYHFSGFEEFTGAARVRLYWHEHPAQGQQYYIALADWTQDRWRFLDAGSDDINAGDAAPYISADGELYCLVLALGTTECRLQRILIGENTTPYVLLFWDLDNDPLQNIAPRTVNVDLSNSSCYGAAISSFDFDWDGDGVWDLEGDADGLAAHDYTAGNWTLKVRATEESGRQGLAERKFTLIDPNNQTPLAVINADLSSGEAPLKVSLDALQSSDPDGVITKYEWDFDDDGEWDLTTDDPSAVEQVFTTWGGTKVTLRVTDNFFAQATAELVISVSSGWWRTVIESGITASTDLSVCTGGSGSAARACVAYCDYVSGELHFAHAFDNAATIWQTPLQPFGDTPTVRSFHGTDMQFSAAAGAPMLSTIVEFSNFNRGLYFISAKDALGNQWNDEIGISSPEAPRYDCALNIVNGKPVIAATFGQANFVAARVMLSLAADAQGSSWGQLSQALAPLPTGGYRGLSLLPGPGNGAERILLGFVEYDGSGYQANVMRSLDAAGSAWELPDVVVSSAAGQSIDSIHLAYVAGLPALMTGSHTAGMDLHYARAADATGENWTAGEQVVHIGGYGDLVIWNGLPCMAYSSVYPGGVWFVQALDAQGSAWAEPMPIDQRSGVQACCDITVVNNHPVICYGGPGNTIMSAAWQ